MQDKFDKLKTRNTILSTEIDSADREGHHSKAIELKKELYKNKLTMLELITFEKKVSNSYTAQDLKNKIAGLKPAIRYETGVRWLDEQLVSWNGNAGLEVGSLILLGGQSFGGKTTLLLQILANVSKYAKTLFFNFEMGDRRINHRLGKLLKSDEQMNNFMLNTASRDLDDLVMEITLMAEDGVKFFAIDSRLKITSKDSLKEHLLASKITQRLSQVAIENDIIIFLINQISESDLKDKRLSFKASGDQLYDADYAFFILVEKVKSGQDKRYFICTKNRADERTFRLEMPPLTSYKEPVEISFQNDKIDATVL